jgi:hypothetical protein
VRFSSLLFSRGRFAAFVAAAASVVSIASPVASSSHFCAFFIIPFIVSI